jgi:hypothetical protein
MTNHHHHRHHHHHHHHPLCPQVILLQYAPSGSSDYHANTPVIRSPRYYSLLETTTLSITITIIIIIIIIIILTTPLTTPFLRR